MWPLSVWSRYVTTAEATVACVSVWSLSESLLQKTALRNVSKLSPQAVYLPCLRPRLITNRMRSLSGQASADGARTSAYRFYKRCHLRRSGLMGYPVKQYLRAGRVSSSFKGWLIKSVPFRHLRTIAQWFETFSSIGSGLSVNLEMGPIDHFLNLLCTHQLNGFASIAVTPQIVLLIFPGLVMRDGVPSPI